MSGAEGSSRQHFSGRVYTAGEPCGGQRTCVRQNRVVLAVVATVKLLRRRQSRQPARCRRISLERGRPERTRLPGEHGISRPTTAQGRPSDWLHLYAAVRFFCVCFRAADRGCQPAPGLPCALLIERVERVSKARAKSAARMRRCVCKLRCGLEDGDDAPCSVIASAAKQSRVFPRRDSGLLRCARNDDVERRRALIHHRHPEVLALRRKRAAGQASKGDGPAASRPFILRGSACDACASQAAHLRSYGWRVVKRG
jgi:hypothetical protein